MTDSFNALVVEEKADQSFERSVRKWPIDKLPDHEVLINVKYSSLNYKDALSATGNKGVTQHFPHIPGIDAAGVIERSGDDRFEQGDPVIVTSYDLGQNTSGGFGEYIRVPGDWIVPLPKGLDFFEAMALGTAGLTAAIGIHHLKHNSISPEDGPILVTGATGGVATMAISILAKLGYHTVAATGKSDRHEFLNHIGAATVIDRTEVQEEPSKPLLGSRWAGAIETVGGAILDTVLRQTRQGGTVACCGNVLGHELNTNVYPFILRGVNLAGIDSGYCPMELRSKLWNYLASSWKPEKLKDITRICTLAELDQEIDTILEGGQVGRVVVNLDKGKDHSS